MNKICAILLFRSVFLVSSFVVTLLAPLQNDCVMSGQQLHKSTNISISSESELNLDDVSVKKVFCNVPNNSSSSNSILSYTIVRYLSDLHIEFYGDNTIGRLELQAKIRPTPKRDGHNITEVLVLAGDIGNPYFSSYTSFLANMNSKFSKIFLLAGNHEYYTHRGSKENGQSVEQTNAHIQHLCDTLFPNIVFLNNQVWLYNSIYFVGTTQWGDLSRTAPQHIINDALQIKDMDAALFTAKYRQSAQFLLDALHHIEVHKKPSNSVVVLTHHQPSHRVIAEKFRTSPVNGWFAGSLDALMERYDPIIDYWVYGHTHDESRVRLTWPSAPQTSVDGTAGAPSHCLYVCNPVGYPGKNKNVDYGAQLVVCSSRIEDDVGSKVE
jgi:predicted MPP superfamily phosphohydrolase